MRSSRNRQEVDQEEHERVYILFLKILIRSELWDLPRW